jgi:hypothetical protein
MRGQTWQFLFLSAFLTSGAFAADVDFRGNTTPEPARRLSVAGRHRLELRVGFWDAGPERAKSPECAARLTTEVEDLLGALAYSYWVQETFAVDLTFRSLVAEVRSTTGPANDCETAVVLNSAMVGLRYYPLVTSRTPVRPYATLAAGPVLGVESIWEAPDQSDADRTRTEASFGGHAGGGIDIQLGRYFMLGMNAGYNFMKDFLQPLGGQRNYRGVEYGIGISVLIGRGAGGA